jgi:hypothetical protein
MKVILPEEFLELTHLLTKPARAKGLFFRRFTALAIVVPLLGFIAVGPVAAQQQSPQQATPQQAPDIQVEENEMEATAQAYVKVEEITAKYRAEFGDTQDPQQAAEIQQDMREETDASIEDEGLEPERYDAIIQAAQSDENLHEQLLGRIKELQDGGDGDG